VNKPLDCENHIEAGNIGLRKKYLYMAKFYDFISKQ